MEMDRLIEEGVEMLERLGDVPLSSIGKFLLIVYVVRKVVKGFKVTLKLD